MLNTAMHRPRLRMLACILGELIAAFSLNYFIVPLGLYSGGSMGVCQLLRTLLQIWGGLSFGTMILREFCIFSPISPFCCMPAGFWGGSSC